MTSKTTQQVSPLARADAAEWFVVLQHDPDAHNREDFYNWLRKSPENVHAFLRITALWEDAELLALSPVFNRETLLAKAKAEPANIVPMDGFHGSLREDQGQIARTPSTGRARRTTFSAIAASLIVAIATATWFGFFKDTYATDIGEQRSITLTDGSTIILNSGSRARVRFTDLERNIDLLRGQAIFRVAHNAARPFIVHAGTTNIRAVGTQFDVYRKAHDAATTVTVIEGRVAVIGAGQDVSAERSRFTVDVPGEILVAAGEQLTIPAATPAQVQAAVRTPKPADIEAATAWTQGRLVFNETSLSDVVTEFNRYSVRQLVIDDPELESFHISGTFPSNDPTRVAELLRQRFDVTVEQSDDEIRIVRK
jgi:transmembrane sensor